MSNERERPTSVLVLPTFNECENIERFLAVVRAANPTLSVVVVDDMSPDGTGQIVERLATPDGLLSVIHRSGKKGLGAAYLAGFARALEQGFDNVLTMDADFSHDPTVIPQLISALERPSAVVIGSRYVKGGSIVGWPLHRHVLSKYGNFYTRFVLGLTPRDCTSGFRAYRASTLSSIDLQSIKGDGYVFLTSILRRIHQLKLTITEVPITFTDRVEGQSKMSPRIVAESMLLVTLFGLKDLIRRRR
ncbi:MAG: polyprenol monophosphomannose synthase [Ilumatobacteraceae bacterium]